MTDTAQVAQQTLSWLRQVVIGLNLCPFARVPESQDRIRLFVSEAQEEASLLEDVQKELLRLQDTPVEELETSLLIVPDFLQDFMDYNQFLDWIDQLLRQQGWEGVFQVATFHPDYCFAGTDSDDAENLTNRAPYPVFHLIREASLEKALQFYPNPEEIPENNIARMNALTEGEKLKLFPYLFGNG